MTCVTCEHPLACGDACAADEGLALQEAVEGRPRPYYEDDLTRLYLGDLFDVLPRLGETFTVCVTDPPYNAKKDYGKNTDDNRSWMEWASWIDDALDLLLPMTKDGVLMTLSQPAYRAMCRYGRKEIVWSMAWVKPFSAAICAAPWMPHWEHIAYWGEKRRKPPDLGWGGDVITANVEIGALRTYAHDHPTPKPIKLMRKLLERIDPESVLDPFAGSSTTLLAAKQQSRRSVGVEIEERWCAASIHRLAAMPPTRNEQAALWDGADG